MSEFVPVIYKKSMTPFYISLPEEIKFEDVSFLT